MIEVAEYPSECRICWGEIKPGQRFVATEDGDTDHFDCLDPVEQVRWCEA